MKVTRLGLLIASLVCSPLTHAADPAEKPAAEISLTPVADAIAALQKTAAARIEQANAGETVPNRFDWTSVEGELEQIKTQALSNNTNEAKNAVRALVARVKSDELKKLLGDLSTAIDAQKIAESEARRIKFQTQLADITRTALKAETAAAIDPLFDRLSALEEELGNNYDARMNRLRNHINQGQNFLRQWQDLVDNLAEGQSQQVRQALNNFRHNFNVPPGITRSELRDHVKKMRAKLDGSSDNGVGGALENLSVDRIADVQQQLIDGSEQGWSHEQNERSNLISQLDAFRLATEALNAGNVDEALMQIRSRGIVFHGGRSSSGYAAMQRLRNEWIIRSLPALTGLKDLAPPTKDETASAYIQRLLLAADAAQDWNRAKSLAHVGEAIDLAMVPGFGPGAPNSAKGSAEAAITFYQKALLMEQANQLSAAAELFRDALKQAAPPRLQAVLIARLKEAAAKDSAKPAAN